MSPAPSRDGKGKDDARRSAEAAAVLGALLALGALGLYGARAAFSVCVGATIAVGNLLTMRAIIQALIRPPEEPADANDESTEDSEEKPEADHARAGRRGGTAWGVFALLKTFILFGGVWILLTRGLVDPMPLVVGYGVLPLGITLAALWSSLRSPYR